MNNIKFRDDISGLRAISVLIIILYHIDAPMISGGFIGVDVFFVLSGYLITTTIYNELQQNSFSYKSFYLRRIRRLIPLLLFVLLASILFFGVILLPEDFIRFSNTVGLSFLSSSNFYLNNITSGYWAAKTQLLPLLHTWSLSVEEQFYIIWPTLLALLHKFYRKKTLIHITTISIIIFLIYSEYASRNDPSFAYYLLPARIFELLIGALLALTISNIPQFNAKTNHFISLLGISGIMLPAFILTKGDTFPGVNAALVCIASALLIISGKDSTNKGGINILLANRILVYIGLISYSLYLWHWPVVVFFNYLSIEKTLNIKLICLSITFLLSVFSYHFIEQVFRFKYKYNLKKTLVIFILIPFFLFSMFVSLTHYTKGFPFRFSGEENQKISLLYSINYNDCPKTYCEHDFKQKFTEFEQADFLLVGDSHAEAIAGFFNVFANKANLNGYLIHHGGTPFLINTDRIKIRNEEHTDFSEKNRRTKALIEKFQGNTIVLAARYSKYFDRDYNQYFVYPDDTQRNYETSVLNFKKGLTDTVEYILSKGKRVIIVKDVPYFSIDRSKCDIQQSILKGKITCNSTEKLSEISKMQQVEMTFFKELKNSHPEVKFIDTRFLLCQGEICDARSNGITLYRDNGHLNYVGSKLLGEKYLKMRGNPLKLE